MATPLRTTSPRHHARRCVRCGYDGPLLKGGRAARCSRCGCDLRERPARSYAEMEGFTPVLGEPRRRGTQREQRIVERWMALIVLGSLVAASATLLLARVI